MTAVKNVLYAIGLPVLLIALWWGLTVDSTSFYVPKPGQLAVTLWKEWVGERFLTDFLPSVGRLTAGLVATIVLGILLGALIGSVRRAIPPPVLVPLLMLLIGINNQMKVVVIVSGAIWPVLLNTVEGVRAIDTVLGNTCRSYRIGGLARWRYLVLPSASPQIMAGIRQSLSIGLILMVISEMFGSSSGLGFTIVLFQRAFAIPEMWSGIVVLGLIGIVLSVLFQLLERRVLHWYHGLRKAQRDA